jgi:hypothetical protein
MRRRVQLYQRSPPVRDGSDQVFREMFLREAYNIHSTPLPTTSDRPRGDRLCSAYIRVYSANDALQQLLHSLAFTASLAQRLRSKVGRCSLQRLPWLISSPLYKLKLN